MLFQHFRFWTPPIRADVPMGAHGVDYDVYIHYACPSRCAHGRLLGNDTRTFARVKHLHSSTIDRPTSLLHTSLHYLCTHREAGNACKTNEKQRKVQNTESERYDAHINQRTRHRDSLRQRSHQGMHIKFERKSQGNLIFRKSLPRLSQGHFLAPGNAALLPPKSPDFSLCMPRLAHRKAHSVEFAQL